MFVRPLFCLLLATLMLWPAGPVFAQEKEQDHQHLPAAFRTWPNQTISIETYWGFTVAIGPGAAEVPGIDKPDQTLGGASLEVIFGEEGDIDVSWWDGEEKHGLVRVRADQHYSVRLDRKPNDSSAQVWSADGTNTSHAVRFSAWPIDGQALGFVHADGVSVVYGSVRALEKAKQSSVDIAVIAVNDVDVIGAERIKWIAQKWDAGMVYIAGDTRVVGDIKTRKAIGNTTALIAGEKVDEDGPILIEHADAPWQMPDAMKQLYDDLDATSRRFTPVFEELSVNQMNHKPANGTHTPRWNIEHMASRQMFFITAAYYAADARFPHIQLDPKQMPPDYVARHPDWDGAEEARRVYRTNAFLRRFAYLYHDRDLDAPIAEGGRIRFAPIMRQVTRHWGLHTPNVQDKMKQDDWPAE